MYHKLYVVALALLEIFRADGKSIGDTGDTCLIAKDASASASLLQARGDIKTQTSKTSRSMPKSSRDARQWWDGRDYFDLPESVCDIQRVDGPSWFAAQGCSGETCAGKMPQEPTIFTGLISDWPALNMTWDYDTITNMFGNVELEIFDEWQQAGGNVHLVDVGGRLKQSDSVRPVKEIVNMWKKGFMGQHEDFFCADLDDKSNDRNGFKIEDDRPSESCALSLCCQMKMRNLISVPEELSGDSFMTGQSFSLSPEGGGFAMHTHAGAWLGLVSGEKAWFLDHPDEIGANRPWYYTVLPLILPARAFAREVMQLPEGQRPKFCIQRPGEVAYLPDGWWHATLNRGDFALGFGTKPQWFNQQYTQTFCGKGSHEYNCAAPGDRIAEASRKRQKTNVPELMANRSTTDLAHIANVVVERAMLELEQDRKSQQNLQKALPAGANARTAANLLCIMASSMSNREEYMNDLDLAHEWMRQAKFLDPQNTVCRNLGSFDS